MPWLCRTRQASNLRPAGQHPAALPLSYSCIKCPVGRAWDGGRLADGAATGRRDRGPGATRSRGGRSGSERQPTAAKWRVKTRTTHGAVNRAHARSCEKRSAYESASLGAADKESVLLGIRASRVGAFGARRAGGAIGARRGPSRAPRCKRSRKATRENACKPSCFEKSARPCVDFICARAC